MIPPPEEVEKFAQSDNPVLKMTAARLLPYGSDLLEILSHDDHEEVKRISCERLESGKSVLAGSTPDADIQTRARESRDATEEDTLRLMAKDKHAIVRGNVARNPHTPVDILHTLSKDGSPSVKRAVLSAAHAREDAELYETLSEDEDEGIRQDVAADGKTPQHVLLKLAKEDSYFILGALCTRKQLDKQLAEVLSRNPSIWKPIESASPARSLSRNPSFLESMMTKPEESPF